jgi:hypothetical protein
MYVLNRLSVQDKVNVECDPGICDGDEVLVGCRDKQYGTIPKEISWLRIESVESLEEQLPRIIKEKYINGFNFCFIKCSNDRNEQPLIFPPLLKCAGSYYTSSHFYRSLPCTVNALRI